MSRTAIPSWFFVLVVVRDERGRFLVIRERKHGRSWYLPAGRVELGESLTDAAVRETLEESGVEVALNGVICIQHTPSGQGARVRVVFSGRAVGGTPGPTEDSLDAAFVTIDEAMGLSLRSPEVISWFRRADEGRLVALMEILGREGD